MRLVQKAVSHGLFSMKFFLKTVVVTELIPGRYIPHF